MGTLMEFNGVYRKPVVFGVFAFFAIFSLVACSTTPAGTFCDISRPLRPSAAAVDAMTDAEVTAMLQHNRKGERLCKWTR